jgi:hypothetical protein
MLRDAAPERIKRSACAGLKARLLSMSTEMPRIAAKLVGRLFSRPRPCAAQRCWFGSQAAFDLHGRLQPGSGHFQQDLAVPLRFGLAGPTQTLLRELAEFCGRCRHARALASE